jgi:tetratricopeptide (TPR) repeat protein
MGLGDYYLRMIRWRAANSATDAPIVQNFLGVDYAAGYQATADAANREHLMTLIKNEMNFTDAYVVLGDIMYAEEDYRTAIRCYLRASFLGHPTKVPIQRYKTARKALASTAPFGAVIDSTKDRDPVFAEFAAAANWLDEYQAIEKVDWPLTSPQCVSPASTRD